MVNLSGGLRRGLFRIPEVRVALTRIALDTQDTCAWLVLNPPARRELGQEVSNRITGLGTTAISVVLSSRGARLFQIRLGCTRRSKVDQGLEAPVGEAVVRELAHDDSASKRHGKVIRNECRRLCVGLEVFSREAGSRERKQSSGGNRRS